MESVEGSAAIPMATTTTNESSIATSRDRSVSGSGSTGSGSGSSDSGGDGGNVRRNSLTSRKGGSKGGEKNGSARKQTEEAYIEGDIKLRFLCPDDVEAVKNLCREWFPVE